MKLQPSPALWSKQGLSYVTLVALIYGLLIMANDYALVVLPGLQVRFSAFLPVVAGMLLGSAGAWGSMLGCFVAELLQTGSLVAAVGFALITFLWGYLPYKLWFAVKSDNATLYIYNKTTFVKFIIIVAVVAFNLATSIGALVDLLYPDSFTGLDKLFLLFANNFDFAILFGIPLLFYIRNNSKNIYYEPACSAACGGYQLPVLAVVSALSTVFLVLEQMALSSIYLTTALLGCNVLGLAYVATIPSHYAVSNLEKSSFRSVSAELTVSLINLVTITIIVIVLSSIMYSYQGLQILQDIGEWHKFYTKLFLILNVGLVCIFILLKDIEISIIGKLESLAAGLKGYVQTGEVEQSSEQLQQLASRAHRNELEVLEGCLSQLKLDINSYLNSLTKTLQDKHKLQSQLEIAENIQKGMLPKLEDIDLALQNNKQPYTVLGGMKAAKTVGGDVYDCFLLDDKHLLFMIADVEGKGLPAALFMVVTQALLNNAASEGAPSQILEKVNNALAKENKNQFFVSMWMGIMELSSGTISYVNAGHKPPLVCNQEGLVKRLDQISGPVLGHRNTQYKDYTFSLQAGERLFLYTEGFSDSMNDGQEVFGMERLEQAVAKAQSPDEIIATLNCFMAGSEQLHDMTYLWLERG